MKVKLAFGKKVASSCILGLKKEKNKRILEKKEITCENKE